MTVRPVAKAEVGERTSVFISHATPHDNAFATWLASRLSMAGYDVWCDQEKLLGGEDFWHEIEKTLRHKAVKFIAVVSENAFDENGRVRDGIGKEIALANIVKRQVGDEYFIIPMRIDDTDYGDFPIDFIRLNGIDCGAEWATGLSALLEVLERDGVVRTAGSVSPSLRAWRDVHKHHTRAISSERELLQSNRLPILELPEKLHFYESPGARWNAEPRALASNCPLPCVDHHRLLVSFASLDELQSALGNAVPIRLRGTLNTIDFIDGLTGDIVGIHPRDAKNKVTSLVRQIWDIAMQERGLVPYEMANTNIAWWFPEGVPEDGQLRYQDFSGKSRRRAVSGIRGKKEAPDGRDIPRYYWHLGFTRRPVLTDSPFIVLQPRIIISEDGKTPLENKTRLNSVRRSLTKMWFNDKWRSLTLAFSSWLADGKESFALMVGEGAAIRCGGKPMTFESPVGITTDPVSFELTDELAEEMEQAETQLRLSDPAFIKFFDEDDTE